MTELAEVLRAQPEQRSTVELGVTPDVVVDLGRELAAVAVIPELRGPLLPLHEHLGRVPVVTLAGQITPPRSSINTRFPEGASRWANVPPPAPVPMTMTS
jgi:hypothetical protein